MADDQDLNVPTKTTETPNKKIEKPPSYQVATMNTGL